MITKPSLLLDENICRKNIETMCLKAQAAGIDFRPHFKTHQSLEIGSWFKEFGVDKITVSSLTMAEYFSADWQDITVAFPVNILEIETINRLAKTIQLNVLLESAESAHLLKAKLKYTVGFFIKIDVGAHRTGLDPADTDTIDRILTETGNCDQLKFKGFLTHAGHTYKCSNSAEILDIHQKSLEILTALKQQYIDKYSDIIVSIGDTPSCSILNDFTGADELRPGNFVFFDFTQYYIGACKINQIAVAMACPIVAIHAQRNKIVIYGGGVHFSKEQLSTPDRGISYGVAVERLDSGWGDIIPGMHLKSLSQEHGIVSVPDSKIGEYKIGDHLLILPVHSCMTADTMRVYVSNKNFRSIERL